MTLAILRAVKSVCGCPALARHEQARAWTPADHPGRVPRTSAIRTITVAVAMAVVSGCAVSTPPGGIANESPLAARPVVENGRPSPERSGVMARSQSPPANADHAFGDVSPGSDDHFRRPMAASGVAGQPPQRRAAASASLPTEPAYEQTQYGAPLPRSNAEPLWNAPPPSPNPSPQAGPGSGQLFAPPGYAAPNGSTGYLGPTDTSAGSGVIGLPSRLADVIVNVEETQTGRLMLGAGVNSDAGLTGQLIIDERNFDWRRFPTSFDDFFSGRAFRGAGQGFRMEAMPGSQFQRYLVNFVEPYLGGTRVSLSLSGYLYDRRYFDWDEQRFGGRVGLGYGLTPDLSLNTSIRAEQVDISDPRVLGVPELDAALGRSDLYSGRVSLIHDTRDIPFAPTEGHLLDLSYEQTFGTFDYPRGIVDYRKYLLLTERLDGSGRHVLSGSMRVGFSGAETPIYENFFAGGHATLRGFRFREASPVDNGVRVGGEFMMLGSFEYLFPITADDMLKGVTFVDYGTVEEKIEIDSDNFRVAVGAGLRVFIPAMGPAPIALDFAVPVARAYQDRIQTFSFFIGVGR